MLHLYEEAIAANCMMHFADKPFNNSYLLIVVEVNRSQIMKSNVHGVAICMMYFADKPFNNSYLLIVVEVNRSQIMKSNVIHSCQDRTVLCNNVKPFLKRCMLG